MKKLNLKKKKKTFEQKVPTNKKLSKSALILIIGSIIILIPCIIFAAILGISALQTGSPRDGSRFKNDFTNEISKDHLKQIESDMNSISNLEKVEVKLSEGQLKIFLDTNDSLSSENIDSIILEAYNKVTSRLPISEYFTVTDSAKMYDLQINVYTTLEAAPIGSSSRSYKVLHKNAAEESYKIDDLANPKDAELAKELEGIASGEIIPSEDESLEEEPIEE